MAIRLAEQTAETIAFYKADRFIVLAAKSLEYASAALTTLPDSKELQQAIASVAEAKIAVGYAHLDLSEVGVVVY
jgi:hypothetical protein